jgi:ribA/ribD-fused uncharacterized protein
MQIINRFCDEMGFLSNFYPSPIEVCDTLFPTVEHAYQWFKTTNPMYRELILNARLPGMAKRLGKEAPLRKNWDSLKLSVMRDLVTLKFSDPEFAGFLICTGDAELIEGNYWGDEFWGQCNGIGANHLGKILMKIRDNINVAVNSIRPPEVLEQ